MVIPKALWGSPPTVDPWDGSQLPTSNYNDGGVTANSTYNATFRTTNNSVKYFRVNNVSSILTPSSQHIATGSIVTGRVYTFPVQSGNGVAQKNASFLQTDGINGVPQKQVIYLKISDLIPVNQHLSQAVNKLSHNDAGNTGSAVAKSASMDASANQSKLVFRPIASVVIKNPGWGAGIGASIAFPLVGLIAGLYYAYTKKYSALEYCGAIFVSEIIAIAALYFFFAAPIIPTRTSIMPAASPMAAIAVIPNKKA